MSRADAKNTSATAWIISLVVALALLVSCSVFRSGMSFEQAQKSGRITPRSGRARIIVYYEPLIRGDDRVEVRIHLEGHLIIKRMVPGDFAVIDHMPGTVRLSCAPMIYKGCGSFIQPLLQVREGETHFVRVEGWDYELFEVSEADALKAVKHCHLLENPVED